MKFLRLISTFVAALCVYAPVFAQKAETVDQGQILKIESKFMQGKWFTAKFKQTFHNAAMGTVEVSGGTVAVEKPLKMRWEYKTPQEQTIVADGKAVYFYVPSEKRAIVEQMGNVINSRSPALFLAGGRRLEEIFVVKPPQKGDEIGKMDGKILLSLEPKEKGVSVSRMVLAVDAADYSVRAISLYDWAGNRSDIEFLGMEINGKIDHGQFVFKKPAGVELLDTPKF
ncbi:MAG: outer membrane lipoprotein carrier protein LolA [Nitrospinae bacterium]|nr:outer membrane lipoprotein carrier protein LolA [Nitrospinota bacterium]